MRPPAGWKDELTYLLAFLAVRRPAVFFGTFWPAARASDRPIAIACLRLLTVRPERPLFNVPALRFFIARSTLLEAFLEYLRAMIFLLTRAELIGMEEDSSRLPLALKRSRYASAFSRRDAPEFLRESSALGGRGECRAIGTPAASRGEKNHTS